MFLTSSPLRHIQSSLCDTTTASTTALGPSPSNLLVINSHSFHLVLTALVQSTRCKSSVRVCRPSMCSWWRGYEIWHWFLMSIAKSRWNWHEETMIFWFPKKLVILLHGGIPQHRVWAWEASYFSGGGHFLLTLISTLETLICIDHIIADDFVALDATLLHLPFISPFCEAPAYRYGNKCSFSPFFHVQLL